MRLRKRSLFWLIPLSLLVLGIILPLPQRFLLPPQSSARIVDRSGALLYEVQRATRGSRQWLALSAIPDACQEAILAIEDRTFYMHSGISLKGTARALLQNLSSGERVSGGSTITQQLARITLGSRARTVPNKILEALLAIKMEQSLSKEDILERYLNSAYFGHRAYGLSAAARTYFDRSAGELSPAQCALLAGLPQSPSSLDPFLHLQSARERQGRVLEAMEAQGALTQAEKEQLLAEPVTLAADRTAMRAPHFVLWLLSERPQDILPPVTTTTLDLALQQTVERIVERHLTKLKDKNVTSAAVVVLDARTGDVLTMIGSADYFDEEHDGAVNVALAPRQPGSALKPFTYALALARGDTAATTVADTAVQFLTKEGTPYTPRNYDFLEHGLVRYREALANSYNIAAVRVAERVGVDSLLSFLRSVGLTTLTDTPEHYGLALTLGDAEIRLLELVQAYGIFARAGRTLPIRTLKNDPMGNGVDILDPRVAWLITDILSDDTARLAEFGESGPLSFDFPVAAKTGTTRNSRDNWTIGFTPERIVGVWVGNADNTPMKDTSGVTGAGPIFHDVLVAASTNNESAKFTQPQGLRKISVCSLSGKLPTGLCPHTVDEWFIEGTEPKIKDDIFQSFLIDTRNGLLANKECDQTFTQEKGFAVFPKDVEKWAREQGWPTAPTRFSPLCGGATGATRSLGSSWIEITRPQAGESFLFDPLIPDSQEKIVLEAHASTDRTAADWLIDDRMIGTALSPDFRLTWRPAPGKHVITIRSGDASAHVAIEVLAQ